MLRDRIRRLSPRAELVLVSIVAFGYFTATSVAWLLVRPAAFTLGTPQVTRGLLIELALFAAFAAILRARGWTAARLGLRFSVASALAGIPLFMLFMVLYAIAAGVALRVMPIAEFRFSVHAPFWLMILFIVVNSFYEEITVTGYVIAALSSEGAALAITASTLIRFAYHLYQGPIAAVTILPLGVLFGAVFWRWRTLTPLIVAHTLTNLLTFFGRR